MIDINELRQSLGAVQPEEVAELLDRLEAAETAWKVSDKSCYDLPGAQPAPSVPEKIKRVESDSRECFCEKRRRTSKVGMSAGQQ